MPTRDDLPPMERAVSNAFASCADAEEFLERLADAGYDVVPTVELAELRRDAVQASVLAVGIGEHFADFTAAQARAERAEATLARVRAATEKDPPMERFTACAEPSEYEHGWAAAMAAIETALDGPAVSEEQTGDADA